MDYEAVSGQAIIAPGEWAGNVFISVPVFDDFQPEDDEYFILEITNVVGASLGSPSFLTTTIQDNDAVIQFTSATYTVGEAGGSAEVTVNRVGGKSFSSSVSYAMTDVTAWSGSDYTAADSSLSFDPGETSKTISVPITNDKVREFDESLKLTLSNPFNAALGSPTVATLKIIDDDNLSEDVGPPTPPDDCHDGLPGVDAGDGTVDIDLPIDGGSPGSGGGWGDRDDWGIGIPGIGIPGYGTPGFGGPGYGIPGIGDPGSGGPGYGIPGIGIPGYPSPGVPGVGGPPDGSPPGGGTPPGGGPPDGGSGGGPGGPGGPGGGAPT